MDNTYLIAGIAVVAAVTALLRFLPFLIFKGNKPTPKLLVYLGKVLPFAIMGMLVVFCLKNVSVMQAPHGLPELIASAVVVALHIWRKNTLLSIGVGTVLYMVLVQFVFVG